METDIERAANDVAAKLRARGVSAEPRDSADDLVRILEAVEGFEQAVIMAGGDLMVDEPPPQSRPQPDDPVLMLPRRGASEPAPLYLERLARATDLALERVRD